MISNYPKFFMKWNVENIRNYMKEKNIENNLELNNLFDSLGIYKIDKTNLRHWKIYMEGPKYSLYKNGHFSITIDFPDIYPKYKPEIRFVNKIYHLQVSPSNGHVCAGFLNLWTPGTTITECLVGIYLFLALEQNPSCPYSSEMAREYENDRQEFNRKAKEWTRKYAPIPEDFSKMLYENKFCELEKKNKILESNVTKLQNEVNELKSLIVEKDSKIDFYKDKYIKLLEEFKEIKQKNQ